MKRPKLRWNRRRFFWTVFLGSPLAALADAFLIEPGWLAVRKFRLNPNPTIRLVHFSDLHHKGDEALLAKMVDTINALEPDVVCFTGDLIEQAKHLPAALAGLKKINAPLFGVPGNHDYWAHIDFELPRKAFKETGGRWLMNDWHLLEDLNLRISGLTCEESYVPPRDPAKKHVALLHYPKWIETLPPNSVDLALAGHSHGGQVRIPFIGPVITPSGVGKYKLGRYEPAAGPFYVTSGVGYFLMNIRFNCRPEIALFEL
jgi:predicted MPP superfamily phosphohydrolase